MASGTHSAAHLAPVRSVLVACALIAAANLPAQVTNQRTVELASVEGDVQLQHAGGQPVKAGEHMSIQQGDTLTVGMGFAKIYFEDGATGYLVDNSKLTFTELDTNGSARVTRLTLSQGTARFFANTRGVNTFSIETPNFTAAPNPMVDFHLTVDANGSSVAVARGAASVSRGTSTWAVNTGETSSLANGATQAKTAATPPPDIYQTWFPIYVPMLGPQFPSGIPVTPPAYNYLEPIPIPTGPRGIPQYGPRIPHARSPR